MKNVFKEDIEDWNSWGCVFQSILAFKPIIKKIFKKHSLPMKGISHLTAGSNAVFKVGNYVVKIFAPLESSINTEMDYLCELHGCKRAQELGITTPNIILSSSIQDKYFFRYIITKYIKGTDAKDIIKSYTQEKKIDFVHKIKDATTKLNTLPDNNYPWPDITSTSISTRWQKLPSPIVTQIKELVTSYNAPEKVYVHGDITGDNVLIDKNDTAYLIDFADAKIAPKEYEYPPLLFDLFDFDKVMISEFIGSFDIDDFTDKCFYGILMHEFGIYFVELICKRLLRKNIMELNDIFEIKEAIKTFYSDL